MVGLEIGRSRDVHETFLLVGIVLLPCGVELLYVELLQHLLNNSVTLDYHLQELVAFGISFCKLATVGHAICYL